MSGIINALGSFFGVVANAFVKDATNKQYAQEMARAMESENIYDKAAEAKRILADWDAAIAKLGE